MATAIQVPSVYEQLYETDKHFVVCSSGRTAGKSKNTADYIVYQATQAVAQDIVLCRDSYSDMADSMYASVLKSIGEQKLGMFFISKKQPLRIICTLTNCNIYFMGIGGSDKSRTKSFEPINPKVRLFVFEELQQVKDQESLEQALASFRRHISPEGKFIFLFNPPAQNAHWVNVWCTGKLYDSDYLVIKSSWLDVIDFLNDIDIKEILKCKMFEPEKYEWLYMGKTGGGFGSVYPQFKRDKHLLPIEEAKKKFSGHYIKCVIIGGDNAVSRDGTCLCPIFVFDNGQCCVMDLYFHDPQTSGDLSVAEQLPYMLRWLKELEQKYRLTDPHYEVPIAFVIDGSVIGQELIRQLRVALGTGRYDIMGFTKKHVIELASNLKSVFARNMLYIADFGGHYNYAMDRWERRANVLAEQIENLVWNDKQDGFNPITPNDCSDALTYGANAIFRNVFNLYYVDDIIRLRQDYYDMSSSEVNFNIGV